MIASAWKKEWNKMQRDEYAFLHKGRFKKESLINRLAEKRVPENLQEKLDAAFAKGFELVFEKGTAVIEKTYNKKGIEKKYAANEDSVEEYMDRDSLRLFRRKASMSSNKNLLFSGIEGIGLGAFGVAIPDIPLFTAMILKGVYEVALNFGYEYESEEEKFFILKIIEVSMLHGKELDEGNDFLNAYIDAPKMPKDYDQQEQIKAASASLSTELLYMKFVQMIPVVGAVGGAYDAIYLQKILAYANLKYHRRFLVDRSEYDDMGPELA